MVLVQLTKDPSQLIKVLLPLMVIDHHVGEIFAVNLFNQLHWDSTFKLALSAERKQYICRTSFMPFTKRRQWLQSYDHGILVEQILFVLWPCDIQFASTHYANPTLRTMGCSGKLSSSHKNTSSEKENTQHNGFTINQVLN